MNALPCPPPLADLESPALLLDFDGTLVEIAKGPDAIDVPQSLPSQLVRLAARLDQRLALISGRYVSDLEKHLGPVGISLSGSHGAEFKLAGADEIETTCPPMSNAALASIASFAEANPGLLLEHKPLGVGLHYRGEPALADKVAEFAEELAHNHPLILKHGKMVVEVTSAQTTKGNAVEHLMEGMPFAGSMPVFVGDDISDEDGFLAATSAGGFGILVGEQRETHARYRLASVAAVHHWLGLT